MVLSGPQVAALAAAFATGAQGFAPAAPAGTSALRGATTDLRGSLELRAAPGASAESHGWAQAAAAVTAAVATAAVTSKNSKSQRRRLQCEAAPAAANVATVAPIVDRKKTKQFRKDFMRSDQYFKFSKTQMETAMQDLRDLSGSELITEMRKNGYRLTIGDVTFVLAEAYGFCWGVERAVAMACEARTFFPDEMIWVANEIIHNPYVNANFEKLGMKFIETAEDGTKDFSPVKKGDVVLLPAFGASVDTMALLKERGAQVVDTTCPWVSKVWNSVEKSKDKNCTSIIHGKYDHEETVATKSFAEKYLIVFSMADAEYVANYILEGGDRDEFIARFSHAMSDGFDPDVDLERIGVANQTTMLKGETELIGKLFERTMLKKYGPQEATDHFIAFNTICDATDERQNAMYKMLGAEYEAPQSALYNSLAEEQQSLGQLKTEKLAARGPSSKKMEDKQKGGGSEMQMVAPSDLDFVLVVGGFNSSNTIHLLEITEEENVVGYHVDCAERIGGPGSDLNEIVCKPLAVKPQEAMLDRGLVTKQGFLPAGPLTIGITSGASTPDNTVGDCMERILRIKGIR